MCGTTSVKHKELGYCLNCYSKSPQRREINNKYRKEHHETFRNSVTNATFNKRFGGNRENVFELYGDKCVDCGISRVEYRLSKSRDLDVTHVDGDKKNNDISNLLPLCRSCNVIRELTSKSV